MSAATCEPYEPGSGSEGRWFMDQFCRRCRRWPDDPDAPDQCEIAGRALALRNDEPGYPAEWVSDATGENARCTAFEARGGEPPR